MTSTQTTEPSVSNGGSDTVTTRLLKADPAAFRQATQCNFLKKAGEGQISKGLLSTWLSQDRLYAQAYIGFIGRLLSFVEPPLKFTSEEQRQTSLSWRIIKLLSGCLENILHELQFFTDVATEYDLNLEKPNSGSDIFTANEATKEYLSIFRTFEMDDEQNLLKGLVILWATEHCYLSAWRYAASHLDESKGENDLDGGPLRNKFIPNWTSKEFEDFVAEIADVTDLFAKELEMSDKDLSMVQATWEKVLKIERAFWPEI